MAKVKECRWCDGTIPHQLEWNEPEYCANCGAEWDPVEVEYPDGHWDGEEILINKP